VKRSRASPRWPQPGPLSAGRGSYLLGLSLSGGEVHNHDPLHHGNGSLTSELASPWCCLLLDDGLTSVGLRLLPSMMSVTSPEREVGFRPWRHHPQGNRHHGLNGRSILHSWCGCEKLLDRVLYHGSPRG
jgi:hypothetical protein